MSLSLKAIDRLFARLSVTYGRDFMARYDGQSPAAVKSIWAHELAAFGEHLEMLAWALEHLPERAPNVIEFRNLARRAPLEKMVQLPMPEADPERVKAELAKLRGAQDARQQRDRLDWATRIVQRVNDGERVSMFGREMASDALQRTGAESRPRAAGQTVAASTSKPNQEAA